MLDVNQGVRRTGGLVWIWQQPPKLQAGGSNPLLFAIFSLPRYSEITRFRAVRHPHLLQVVLRPFELHPTVEPLRRVGGRVTHEDARGLDVEAPVQIP